MRSLLVAILLLLFTSCATKYIEVPVETIRTEYVTSKDYRVDSIFIRDSIDRYIKGDTLIIEKYKTIYKYRDKALIDTIIKTDTIEKPVYIESIKEVNKIKWYQLFLIYLGTALLGLVVYNIYKYIRKFIK